MNTAKRLIVVGGFWLWAGACTASNYSARADRVAKRILERGDERVLAGREAEVRHPTLVEAPAEPAETSPEDDVPVPERPPRVLGLRQALETAYASSRALIAEQEALHLDALALSSARHDYSPQLALTLDYLFDDPADAQHSNSSSASFSASQILPTGADLTLTASGSKDELEDASPGYGSLVSLSLVQPLLRGAGRAVAYEPLIQAERNLVYALRAFELFREDFSIDVARRFYDLVNRKQSIDNQQRSLENNEFGRRQAEALFAVGRAKELDVLRARRTELSARNDLLEAREGYELELDRFRIFLGLPEDQPIEVEPDAPEFTPVAYELASALEVAFENRLDLLNRREQLQDVERRVKLARNALLPDLDLRLDTSYGTEDAIEPPFGADFERGGRSVSLSFGVPLDRVDARNSYRSAELGLARARRDLEQFEDELRVSIQSSFRELARRLESLEIHRQLIEDQTKNLRVAELRFERGELPNRDVVEANQSLLEAQNDYIDEQVNYEIARLQLLRDLGILFIDDKGMWKR